MCISPGIRRPTRAFFSLKNSSAYVEGTHCLAYCWGSLSEDADEEDDEERVWYHRRGQLLLQRLCPPPHFTGKVYGEGQNSPVKFEGGVALLIARRNRQTSTGTEGGGEVGIFA